MCFSVTMNSHFDVLLTMYVTAPSLLVLIRNAED